MVGVLYGEGEGTPNVVFRGKTMHIMESRMLERNAKSSAKAITGRWGVGGG